MDKLVKIYQSLSQIPTLLDAKLSIKGNIVQTIWSQRNLEKGKTTKFLRSIILNPDLTHNCEVQPIDVSNELLACASYSERYKAVLRETDDKQYLEIWQRENLFRIVDLNALDVHGKVYVDGEFKSFEWSTDESKVLYIAEKKVPDSEPFYQRKARKEANSEKKTMPGQEYVFRQDWGEQMVGKKKTIIAEYNIEEDSVNVIEGIPEDVCPGQVKYSPCGNFIVGVAYSTLPRKLGLIYCTNRPGIIFKVSKDGQYETVSSENKAARFPIFSPNGKSIVYFEREAKGPHNSAVALLQRNFLISTYETQKSIVGIVEDEVTIENNKKFYGLYNYSFCKRCWASENRLIVTTNQKNTVESYVIDTDSSTITQLPCFDGSLIVFDVFNDIILASRRNFLNNDVLIIGKLPPKGREQTIDWKELTTSKKIEDLENCMYEYLELCHESDDDIKKFSAIYVGPSSANDRSVPLIVYPHGGPHSAFANNFSLDVSFNLSNGYAILLVNYRGSIGAGDKSVQFLLGRIGSTDVSDCILATNKVLAKFPWLDPSKLVLCGGSHGGFLVTHLSGQYPSMFKAVVARNPVIDVASMSIFSDIPDWCFAECGEDYTQKGPLSTDIFLKMRKCSPIEYAHKVQAPTLLQIGSNDLRVPPGQAFDYYHRLKSNGIEVEMHLYDDNHPLGQVKNEMDNLINTVLWLNSHIGKSC